MQVLGFNFIKISGERTVNFRQGSSINTNIEFIDIEKEEISLLKDTEAIKISYKFSVTYSKIENKKESKEGEISIEGNIIMSATKEEVKEIMKFWKKKEIPNQFKVPIFNIILRRCSLKAAQLEDDINLPIHLPLPKIELKTEKKEQPTK